MIALLLVVLTSSAFALGYALAWRRARALGARAPEEAPPLHDLDEPPPEPPARVAYEPHAPEGSPEWDRAMADVGARMRRARVRLVVFVHGSFVGDDPLAIARALDEAPGMGDLARAFRATTRAHVGRLLGDLSNYTREYVERFARAAGVDAIAFDWSGENHHAARVQGAARLARAIALHGGGAVRPGDRVLLAGHSHGGQLFAILSQLVARARGHEDLVAAAGARGEDAGALEEHLALLRRCDVDAVTFGTPPRYGWARGAGFRVLHVVNHRGEGARAGSITGILHTSRGDYVHQLGVPGSDFPAPAPRDRALNARLDRVLGVGAGLRAWLGHAARGMRVAPRGRTVLVDYRDGARFLPNLFATGLGHAAYTRRASMLFHARLVADAFYPAADVDPAPSSLRRGVFGLLPARAGSEPDA